MKSLLFALVLFGAAASQADVVKVVCAQGKNLARAESIKLVVYELNMKVGDSQLSCTKKMDGDFCGSMRMDLSEFVGSAKAWCGPDTDSIRQVYNFRLVQEDEFDNYVAVYINRDCRTGLVDKSVVRAVITNNTSHELPDAVELVNCKFIQ